MIFEKIFGSKNKSYEEVQSPPTSKLRVLDLRVKLNDGYTISITYSTEDREADLSLVFKQSRDVFSDPGYPGDTILQLIMRPTFGLYMLRKSDIIVWHESER